MLIESVARLEAVDLGFETGDLVTAQISLPSSDCGDAASWAHFFGSAETPRARVTA